MKEKRVWIGLATLFAVIGVPQLFWKPSRFGGVFLLALADRKSTRLNSSHAT